MPSSTSLSPLSLHDALPIYPDPRARSQRAATLMAKPLVRLQVVQIGLAVALLALVVRAGQVQLIEGHRYAAAAAAQRTERVQLDRKSTRLNSSHTVISYAVLHLALPSFPTRRSSDLS